MVKMYQLDLTEEVGPLPRALSLMLKNQLEEIVVALPDEEALKFAKAWNKRGEDDSYDSMPR